MVVEEGKKKEGGGGDGEEHLSIKELIREAVDCVCFLFFIYNIYHSATNCVRANTNHVIPPIFLPVLRVDLTTQQRQIS